MKLYFAPLEGLTGYIFRNAYEKHYGHIDKYFAPFTSPADKCAITPRDRKDLIPDNNKGIFLVPQILTNRSDHFIDALKELNSFGYKEVNLNLGCPSGTVCAKGKGAAFLTEPEKLRDFLEDIYSFSENQGLSVSVKTRLGYKDCEEFRRLLEIFNEFPISELIIHPRIREDFYKGTPHREYYHYALDNAKVPLVYNGDIRSKDDYDSLCQEMGQNIDTVMIGRGLLAKPSLSEELQNGNTASDNTRFWKFHDELYEEYKKVMSPDINVLYRMKELWTYWSVSFEDIEREKKHLLKAKKCIDYEDAVNRIKGKT